MQLRDSIREIKTAGGDNNFIIINLDSDYFIQMAGEKGSSILIVEAVSNENLPAKK
jgi:hypothetical protein